MDYYAVCAIFAVELRRKGLNMIRKTLCLTWLWIAAVACMAQEYELKTYPVYQLQTGDVDGDGSTDAMVGVIKPTRFFPEKARRLFIFKQVNGKVRPLWMGSKLGGILQDFRFVDGRIRSLETTTDSLYVVAEYHWGGFGMSFERFIVKGTDQETAIKTFSQ